MAKTALVISVILIFLLILIQNISIRLLFKDKFSAELDYSFFTVVLSDLKMRKKLGKTNPKLFLSAKRAAEFWLRHAKVEISKIDFPTSEDDPKKFSIKYKNLFSLFSALTVYLSKKTKKLIIPDTAIVIHGSPDNVDSLIFDLNVTAPLYVVLASTALFFLAKLKTKKH